MKMIRSNPGIGFLDNRYVNIIGDTMTGDLSVPNLTAIGRVLSSIWAFSDTTGVKMSMSTAFGKDALLIEALSGTDTDLEITFTSKGDGNVDLLHTATIGNLGKASIPWDNAFINEVVLKNVGAAATATNTVRISGLDLAAGDAGLHIKTENDTEHLFASLVGINTTSPIATLDINGGVAFNLVSKTEAYTATVGDHVILCDASGGVFTITLPSASGVTDLILHIKKTDSSGNTVTIDGNSSETIDGATTAVITTQYESIMIICDGSNWHII